MAFDFTKPITATFSGWVNPDGVPTPNIENDYSYSLTPKYSYVDGATFDYYWSYGDETQNGGNFSGLVIVYRAWSDNSGLPGLGEDNFVWSIVRGGGGNPTTEGGWCDVVYGDGAGDVSGLFIPSIDDLDATTFTQDYDYNGQGGGTVTLSQGPPKAINPTPVNQAQNANKFMTDITWEYPQ
jgi:hypothetical protein